MSEPAETGVFATATCTALLFAYGAGYFVARLTHVLVNHGYRIRSSHGVSWCDVVFIPLVELEHLVRGIS